MIKGQASCIDREQVLAKSKEIKKRVIYVRESLRQIVCGEGEGSKGLLRAAKQQSQYL